MVGEAARRTVHKLLQFGTLRTVTLLFGALFSMIGWVTLSYTADDYVWMTPVWGTMFVLSGVISVVFGITRHAYWGVLAGSIGVSASMFRGISLVIASGFEGIMDAVNPLSVGDTLSSAYLVGAMQWFTIGFLVLLIWPTLLLSTKD